MHPQGCQILSLDPLLFGFNHMPVNWHSRQESHLQPPRSKRGALVIEPREQKRQRENAEGRGRQASKRGGLSAILQSAIPPSENRGRRRDSHSRGANARQFTKLLLSLLSHVGWKWWVATVLPRALRFKRPLHRCNVCNPDTEAKAESSCRNRQIYFAF